MTLADLPAINAALNLISTVLLALGYFHIKNNRRATHKKFMVAAVISSALFLTSYLIYHYNVGSVPYPHHDWTRALYFIILIPHIIFAAVMVPFILAALWLALKERFDRHVRLVKCVWPVWMFV